VKAVGMFAQGIAAYDSGKYTRDVDEGERAERAKRRRDASAIASARRPAAMGQQLVDQGGSGFPGTGTALDALHASAINRELDLALSQCRAPRR
jgi:hypothetical protein